MDTRTGELISEEELKKKSDSEKKNFVLIPEKYQDYVEGLNRKDRRSWYKQNKHLWKG